MSFGKTVYVLGAGFSAHAGFPIQGDILNVLLDGTNYGDLPRSFSRDDPPPEGINEKIALVSDFLDTALPNSDERSLEDIFTLLDLLIEARGSFSKYSLTNLLQVREDWTGLLVALFHSFSARVENSRISTYKRFISALLLERMQGKHPHESVSVISLNWDGLLEDSFFSVVGDLGGLHKADIDYCVYTVPISPNVPHVPSTKQKASGIVNFKLLKLHGSVNWFRCPNSNRIYTSVGLPPKEALSVCLEPQISPFSLEYQDSREDGRRPTLERFIVTPTFSKTFDLPHIQNIWQNAFLELRQATKVIFIGYSLPDADYHFKALIRRAVRPETEINVVLSERDIPSNILPEKFAVATRFNQLFGKKRITKSSIQYSGFETFVNTLSPENELAVLQEKIKASFLSPTVKPPLENEIEAEAPN